MRSGGPFSWAGGMGATNRNHKTGKLALAAAEKQLRALELRKAGLGFDAIAAELGYANRGAAHKAVMAALRATMREPAEEVRALYLERLDYVMQCMAPRMAEGNPQAAAAYIKALERQAALLGLDAPLKTEMRIDHEKVAAKIAEATGLPVDEVISVMPSMDGLG